MNWEEKLDALNALSNCALGMRSPGDWYIKQSTDIGGDGFLRGAFGNGNSPETAVEAHWSELVDNLPSDRHIRTRDGKSWRWSGFMWKEVTP